jgi:predicted acetyltransferase
MVQIRLQPSSAISPLLKNHIYYEIRPSMRGQGYGTIALSLAIDQAASLGLRSITLVCTKTNVASQKIIERNGGKLVQEIEVSRYPARFRKYRIVISNKCARTA